MITTVCSRPLVLHSRPDLQGDLLPELEVSLMSSQQGASLPACSISAMTLCIGHGSAADMLPKAGSIMLKIKARTKESRYIAVAVSVSIGTLAELFYTTQRKNMPGDT